MAARYRRAISYQATASRMMAGRPVTSRNMLAAVLSSSAREPAKFWMVKSSSTRPRAPMSHSYHGCLYMKS